MIGSYYGVTQDMYRTPAAALPGWYENPVPGWGTNPMRAGPPRVGVGRATGCACGQTEEMATEEEATVPPKIPVKLMIGGAVVIGVLAIGAILVIDRRAQRS